MDLAITTYDKEGKATVLDMFGVQEDDITIEIGDSGMHIRGTSLFDPTNPAEKFVQIVLGVSVVCWKDAVTLYPEYEELESAT